VRGFDKSILCGTRGKRRTNDALFTYNGSGDGKEIFTLDE